MDKNRKFGQIAIAASIVMALAAIAFSENPCTAGTPGDAWINILLICLHITVWQEYSGGTFGERIEIPTKYLLVACSAIFAVGVLWLKGALQAPGQPRQEALTNQNDKHE